MEKPSVSESFRDIPLHREAQDIRNVLRDSIGKSREKDYAERILVRKKPRGSGGHKMKIHVCSEARRIMSR
jgi:hypothetical protein